MNKKIILVGVFGSLWMFAIEKYVKNVILENTSFFANNFFYQFIMVIILSSIIAFTIYKLTKDMFYVALTPVLWYLGKDLINIFISNFTFDLWIKTTLVEGLLFALPIGLALNYLSSKGVIKL